MPPAFFLGTQAQRGSDEESARAARAVSADSLFNAFKYAGDAPNSQTQTPSPVMSQSQSFKRKVSRARNVKRRKVLTVPDEGPHDPAPMKLRKFGTATKEVLRRFKEGTTTLPDDGLGMLIGSEEWEGRAQPRPRKRRQLLPTTQEGLSSGAAPDSVHAVHAVHASHHNGTQCTLAEVRALYDVSLDASETNEVNTNVNFSQLFDYSQGSTASQRCEPLILTLSQLTGRTGGTLDETPVTLAPGTQENPFNVESSVTEPAAEPALDGPGESVAFRADHVVEIPDTDGDSDPEPLEVVEIENSTDEGESRVVPTSSPAEIRERSPVGSFAGLHRVSPKSIGLGNPRSIQSMLNESPLKSVSVAYPPLVEVPSSAPGSAEGSVLELDAECVQFGTTSQGADADYDNASAPGSDLEANFDDFSTSVSSNVSQVSPSQTQDTGETLGESTDTLSRALTLFASWSTAMLTKQLGAWSLRPLPSRAAMLRELELMARRIPTASLQRCLEMSNGGVLGGELGLESDQEGMNCALSETVASDLRRELVTLLRGDPLLRMQIATYAPLDVDTTYAVLNRVWTQGRLDKAWMCAVLDDMGVCWTPSG